MLEALRRNSKNTIIVILFGVIIAVFVLNFGPGSRGCGGVSESSYAAQVRSTTLGESDFRYAYIASGMSDRPPQYAQLLRAKELVMTALIERELLAQEAERLGLNVSQKEVEDMIAAGNFYVLGQQFPLGDYVLVDGQFNYDRFRALCQNRFGLTVVRFLEQQRRELMAQRVRQLLLAGVQVAPAEVKADWEQRERQVNLEFVRFLPRQYMADISLTPAEIAEQRKTSEKEIKKYYDEHAYLYKSDTKQARLWRVLVSAAKDATPAQEEAAKAKAEQAAKRLRAGEAFDAVARTLSEDEDSRARGGLMGWRRRDLSGLGKTVEEAVFAAQKGSIIGPLRGDQGYEVLRVDDLREGDLPLEAVADDIAEEQLRSAKAKAKAKAEAEQVAAKVKAGAQLATLYPKPTDADESDPSKRQRPSVRETGMFSRSGDLIPDIGVSSEIIKMVFGMKVNEVAGPVEVSDSFVVLRIKERKEPAADDFTKKEAEVMSEFRRRKAESMVRNLSRDRCVDARNDGRLEVNEAVLAYEGTSVRPPIEQKYDPCGNP